MTVMQRAGLHGCQREKSSMRLFLALMVTFLFCSCEKNQLEPGEKVEIYLLKNYPVVIGKCAVDSSIAVLDDTATVKNDDILEYSKSNYQFILTELSFKTIAKLRDGTPYAVTVDRQVIYYGIVKPSYSSSMCTGSITMDNVSINNKITIGLGYPGTNVNIDDHRNNPRLIATLKYQKKLR